MRSLLFTAFVALVSTLGSTAAGAQTPSPLGPPPLSANAILPFPAPKAPLTDWVPADGRKTIAFAVDGITLRGYDYAGATSNAPTVLFFGGNGWYLDSADPAFRAFAARGARIVAYDYRGYGFSDGRADVRTFRRDALRLYDALVAGPGNPHVAVFGFSMGTALATYIASQRKVAGVVLIAPISQALPFFVANVKAYKGLNAATMFTTPDADEAFDEVGMIAKSNAPLLLVHGDADEVVPYREGKEVFEASPVALKTLVTLHGVNHNDAPAQPETMAALGRFFSSLR